MNDFLTGVPRFIKRVLWDAPLSALIMGVPMAALVALMAIPSIIFYTLNLLLLASLVVTKLSGNVRAGEATFIALVMGIGCGAWLLTGTASG